MKQTIVVEICTECDGDGGLRFFANESVVVSGDNMKCPKCGNDTKHRLANTLPAHINNPYPHVEGL